MVYGWEYRRAWHPVTYMVQHWYAVLSVTCHFRDGSFSMVTRTENVAVLQVRRSEKVHYTYEYNQQWYYLTRTESEQCHVHLKEKAVPKDGSTVDIIFDENKYKELEVGAANCTELKCVLYCDQPSISCFQQIAPLVADHTFSN